jgi:hypothetical protein
MMHTAREMPPVQSKATRQCLQDFEGKVVGSDVSTRDERAAGRASRKSEAGGEETPRPWQTFETIKGLPASTNTTSQQEVKYREW